MFTSTFIDYMNYTVDYHKQTTPYENLYKIFTIDELELQAFFREFEYQFSTNKIHLYDKTYKCELSYSMTDKIKQVFIKSMDQIGFTYINCDSKYASKVIEELISMQYTIVIGNLDDCFKTSIYIIF
uniref:Uncharacterized protein n=1 Tax=viral metagenome TaxID=1070528 RepID=A0A6C0HMN5_9ZZZZ